jgi:hypothetical protein
MPDRPAPASAGVFVGLRRRRRSVHAEARRRTRGKTDSREAAKPRSHEEVVLAAKPLSSSDAAGDSPRLRRKHIFAASRLRVRSLFLLRVSASPRESTGHGPSPAGERGITPGKVRRRATAGAGAWAYRLAWHFWHCERPEGSANPPARPYRSNAAAGRGKAREKPACASGKVCTRKCHVRPCDAPSWSAGRAREH